jgi:DNA replication protein
MAKNLLMGAVDFRYVLLDNYKKLSISEEELAVILMISHLLEQGNSLITSDTLSVKMNYKPSDIDKILVGLVNRGFVSFDTSGHSMKTSLEPLRQKLYAEFQKTVQRDQANLLSKDRADRLARLTSVFEQKLARSLSPLESSMLADWLEARYSDEEIEGALADSLRQNKKSMRAVEKALRSKRADEDIAKEGYSGISPSWDKDIEKTIEIAKSMWGDDKKESNK